MPQIDSAYQLLTKLLSPKRHAALTIQKKTEFIQSCADAGDVLVRVGADLVRLKANGEMETLEGFFDQAGLIEQYGLSDAQTLLWRAALSRVISGGVEVAQAQTATSTDATISDSATSDAAAPLENTVVAKVAGISGSAQVIRQGVLTTLSVGDSIYLGDIISSQANSKVNLNVVKSDAANATGPGVSIGESTRMMVTGQFVPSEQTNTKVFELNLKVDAGAVSVDPHPRTDLNIQVQVPQGQIQVPTNGINVKVETQTGQTAVNLPSGSEGNAAAVASVAIVGANGQVSQLQVGQAAQALAAAQPAVAAVAVTTPLASVGTTAVSSAAPTYGPISGNGLTSAVSNAGVESPFSSTTNSVFSRAGAEAFSLGPLSLLSTSIVNAATGTPLPKANELTPPIIPKIELLPIATNYDEFNRVVSFQVKFSSPTSLFVGYTVAYTFRDRNGNVLASDTRFLVSDKQRDVKPGEFGEIINLEIAPDTIRQKTVTVEATLTKLVNSVPGNVSATAKVDDLLPMRGTVGPDLMIGDETTEEITGDTGNDSINAYMDASRRSSRICDLL